MQVCLRSESTALGVLNPTYSSFEHLQKFPSTEMDPSLQAKMLTSHRLWGTRRAGVENSDIAVYSCPDEVFA